MTVRSFDVTIEPEGEPARTLTVNIEPAVTEDPYRMAELVAVDALGLTRETITSVYVQEISLGG